MGRWGVRGERGAVFGNELDEMGCVALFVAMLGFNAFSVCGATLKKRSRGTVTRKFSLVS